jgi:hypothetical protein
MTSIFLNSLFFKVSYVFYLSFAQANGLHFAVACRTHSYYVINVSDCLQYFEELQKSTTIKYPMLLELQFM